MRVFLACPRISPAALIFRAFQNRNSSAQLDALMLKGETYALPAAPLITPTPPSSALLLELGAKNPKTQSKEDSPFAEPHCSNCCG